MKDKVVAVLMGGISNERDISLKTGEAVFNALKRRGYNVVKIDINERSLAPFLSVKFDIAFIALHGNFGEDGTVQGVLEYMGIPYTGSKVLGSAISMNKVLSKKLFQREGIPTGKFWLKGDEGELQFPIVVKPVSEGSTIGVYIVKSKDELQSAVEKSMEVSEDIFFEEYLEGKEVTVSVLNGKALPVIEIRPNKGFYDYTAKYTKGMTEYIIPAQISERNRVLISEYSEKIFKVFNLDGACRVDFIIKDDSPYLLEVNTIPGMTETSLLPKAANHSGVTFEELVEKILLGVKVK